MKLIDELSGSGKPREVLRTETCLFFKLLLCRTSLSPLLFSAEIGPGQFPVSDWTKPGLWHLPRDNELTGACADDLSLAVDPAVRSYRQGYGQGAGARLGLTGLRRVRELTGSFWPRVFTQAGALTNRYRCPAALAREQGEFYQRRC